jgi:hypothetical protein
MGGCFCRRGIIINLKLGSGDSSHKLFYVVGSYWLRGKFAGIVNANANVP